MRTQLDFEGIKYRAPKKFKEENFYGWNRKVRIWWLKYGRELTPYQFIEANSQLARFYQNEKIGEFMTRT